MADTLLRKLARHLASNSTKSIYCDSDEEVLRKIGGFEQAEVDALAFASQLAADLPPFELGQLRKRFVRGGDTAFAKRGGGEKSPERHKLIKRLCGTVPITRLLALDDEQLAQMAEKHGV
jgi:hypothetical protein